MTWYRVKATYQKPPGGFVAVGPLYRGEPLQGDPTRVVLRHHAAPEWTETVALEHLEVDAQEPKRRTRWK
jgi:hypothetical protein